MTSQQISGMIIIAGVVVLVFLLCCRDLGVSVASTVFGTVLGLMAALTLGIWLMMK